MCDSTDRQLDPRPPIGPKAIMSHVSCPNLNLLLTGKVMVLLKLMSRVWDLRLGTSVGIYLRYMTRGRHICQKALQRNKIFCTECKKKNNIKKNQVGLEDLLTWFPRYLISIFLLWITKGQNFLSIKQVVSSQTQCGAASMRDVWWTKFELSPEAMMWVDHQNIF